MCISLFPSSVKKNGSEKECCLATLENEYCRMTAVLQKAEFRQVFSHSSELQSGASLRLSSSATMIYINNGRKVSKLTFLTKTYDSKE